MTEFNTTMRDTEVTVVVKEFIPPIPWSVHEDAWPAYIDYDIYEADGDLLDWVLTREENAELLDDYYKHELESME